MIELKKSESMEASNIRKVSSFTYLNITQFLGALNDNIFKLLIVYFFIQIEGIQNSHKILAAAGATFVAPFLLFSASSGKLADRFSKRNIIIFTKVMELVIMSLGVVAFYYQSKVGSFAILFMLATQSAIFGPSKYGIIPEIVKENKISKANGFLTSFTFLAIILGTFFASFILDVTGKNFIAAASLCTLFSLVGLVTSFLIEYTPPSGSSQKFTALFFYEVYETLSLAKKETSLLLAIIGSAFFLFLAAFAQLNMIPFAVQSLHLTDTQGGYLFLLMAFGIGIGSVFAGKISGDSIELGLVPLATIGITVCLYLLDFLSDQTYAILPTVFSIGFLGGIYQVPIDSYIQVTSPSTHRGQVLAATNVLSFLGVLVASALVFLNTEVFGFYADKGFTIVGTITLLVSVIFVFQFFDYLSRYLCMILSKLHFKTSIIGSENLTTKASVYVCKHTAWNDTLLVLGNQNRRVRFFIEQEQEHHKFFRRLYRLLRVYILPSIEPLQYNPQCLNAIQKTLNKGISVCIFCENEDVSVEIKKLERSLAFQQILKETNSQIIPVSIEKGVKEKETRIFTRLMAKIRIPAAINFGAAA
jgi:acyl-[acyl-carrier-protein]-phospholipid O-acyltransferase / long-chain-fatty-acid--[acyl-carrier-protein] ligase